MLGHHQKMFGNFGMVLFETSHILSYLYMLCVLRSGDTFLEAYKTVTPGEADQGDARSICSVTTLPFLRRYILKTVPFAF